MVREERPLEKSETLHEFYWNYQPVFNFYALTNRQEPRAATEEEEVKDCWGIYLFINQNNKNAIQGPGEINIASLAIQLRLRDQWNVCFSTRRRWLFFYFQIDSTLALMGSRLHLTRLDHSWDVGDNVFITAWVTLWSEIELFIIIIGFRMIPLLFITTKSGKWRQQQRINCHEEMSFARSLCLSHSLSIQILIAGSLINSFSRFYI